ncbi:TetR/AcrR family transcriptional regulator [Ktedonosporobacter rubrisoli]|uniref:TetR/AcrR family transcriptional regulator n=1 Tax=Ktedonosporobacter rubrisoli TaxID=2509675 RepID=A0A4V0YY36_KTERU|nr:TetR-like C-terminal domain-containing protein [Ktedonosporobacter rubrisoli]QBD74851.1 TetR/AcrR family transcriptional regulator [Ktedonosporobacter rubrisoli]
MNSTKVPEDLRVRRTHKLLWEALMALMSERNFDSISVKDICDRAMVHRTTFYKHYEDKYDLLISGMRLMHQSLMKETHLPLNEEAVDLPAQRFLSIFIHVAEHTQFYKLMLCGNGVGTFYTLLRGYLAELCVEKLKRLQRNDKNFEVPIPITAQYWAGAIISLVAWWLENDQPCSPEEMARYTSLLLQNEQLDLEAF